MEPFPWIGPRRVESWLLSRKMDAIVLAKLSYSEGVMTPGSQIPNSGFFLVSIQVETWLGYLMQHIMTWGSVGNVSRGLLLPRTIPKVSIALSSWNPDEALKAFQQEKPNIKIYAVPLEWRNQAKCNLYFLLHIPSVSLPKGSYVIYL